MRDLCFAAHARNLGYEVVIGCKEPYDPELPIFGIPHVCELSPDSGVSFVDVREIAVGPRELAFFSGVGLYRFLEQRFDRRTQAEQVIQAVRGPQLVDPSYAGGYSIKLLGRPMARMVTNEFVLEAVRPHLNPSSFTEIIPVGHDTTYFAKQREGGVNSPMRVGYTTWKSEIGDTVASLLGSDRRFEFRAIRETARWEELRELYHWADVFLATTLPAEGFYLPGLEAMAAGALVLCPDVLGNRAYCRFGENCVLVDYENAQSYAEALRNLATEDPRRLNAMRRSGYETASRHDWEEEERHFGAFLGRLIERLDDASFASSHERAPGLQGGPKGKDGMTNGTPGGGSKNPLPSARLARSNSKALAKRSFLDPSFEFHPVSVHDLEFKTLKKGYPYFGYVDVEVEGIQPFLMFSNNDDQVAQTYFWYGPDAFESLSLRIWRELARQSSHIFDVGAFTGVYSLTAAYANRDAQVYCFEPMKHAFGRLMTNLRVNGLGRKVKAFDVALSDADGHAMMSSFRGYLTLDTGSTFFPEGGPEVVRRERVETTRLDTFIIGHAVPKVDLAKIDVERAEKMVIEGMMGLLEEHRPHLLVEVLSADRLRDLHGMLNPHGYSFAVIDDMSQQTHINDPAAHGEGAQNVLFSALKPAELRAFCDAVVSPKGPYDGETLHRYRRVGRSEESDKQLQQVRRRLEEERRRSANLQERLDRLEGSKTFSRLKKLDALRNRFFGHRAE